jgi:glycerophosphoryl diester phosphodiesterase
VDQHPLLLGHRGARAIRTLPENTYASFDLALAQGCDGFEFDVRLTADGEAVVCHDPKSRGIEIARAKSADLMQLPRLRDVLIRYQHSAFLDIELKVAGLEKLTAKLLRECAPARGYVVSSFLPEVLRSLHKEDSEIPLGLICETSTQLKRWRQLPVAYVIVHHKLARRSAIRAVQSESRKVLVWTVNGVAAMQRLARWGVDGIVSDDTELLTRTLAAAT